MSAPLSYSIDQPCLMPPDLREWLPADDIAYFVSNTIDRLDLSAITCRCGTMERRGRPSYHPLLLTKLIIFGFVARVYSSRDLEAATHKRLDFRILAANQHPDHDTIAAFRQKHLKAIAGLFKQVLQVCIEMHLVAFESLSVDGTKILANASIRANRTEKSLLKEREQQLALIEEYAQDCLKKADSIDAADDAKAAACDPNVKALTRARDPKETLAIIDRLIAEMKEAEASAKRDVGQSTPPAAKGTDVASKLSLRSAERANAVPRDTDANSQPAPAVQSADHPLAGTRAEAVTPSDAGKSAAPKELKINTTDPDSRIVRDGATKSFVQGYNVQAVVDSKNQIIVGAAASQDANDKKQLVPMATLAMENTGTRPDQLLADSGYYSEKQVTDKKLDGIEVLVPPDRECTTCPTTDESAPAEVVRHGNFVKYSPQATTVDLMRAKLKSATGRANYSVRGKTVEPVFGQIKEAAGFRRFLTRGLESVGCEWTIVCMASNLKKMYRAATCKRRDESAASTPEVCQKVRKSSGMQVQMAM